VLILGAPAAWARHTGKHKAPAHPARLLGTEFRSSGGASEIVIHTSREVELEARDEGAAPLFVLKQCRAVRPNDRRPLDTSFFDSPVIGVTLKRRGPDLHVMVLLRAAPSTRPVLRKEHGPGGTWYWILSFPSTVTAGTTGHALHTTAANP